MITHSTLRFPAALLIVCCGLAAAADDRLLVRKSVLSPHKDNIAIEVSVQPRAVLTAAREGSVVTVEADSDGRAGLTLPLRDGTNLFTIRGTAGEVVLFEKYLWLRRKSIPEDLKPSHPCLVEAKVIPPGSSYEEYIVRAGRSRVVFPEPVDTVRITVGIDDQTGEELRAVLGGRRPRVIFNSGWPSSAADIMAGHYRDEWRYASLKETTRKLLSGKGSGDVYYPVPLAVLAYFLGRCEQPGLLEVARQAALHSLSILPVSFPHTSPGYFESVGAYGGSGYRGNSLAAAYDYLRSANALTPGEMETIERKLREGMAVLLKDAYFNDPSAVNWHTAAVSAFFITAVALEDPVWIKLGVTKYKEIMRRVFTSDGLSVEGTGYFGMAQNDVAALALSAAGLGLDLVNLRISHRDLAGRPRFVSLVDTYKAQLETSAPNRTVPVVGDGGNISLPAIPSDAAILPYVKDEWYLKARSWPPDLTLDSRDLPGVGWAILRSGKGAGPDDLYVFLKYGMHGMWHEHYDLLNLILYGYGKYLAPDLGSDARSTGYTPLRTYHCAQVVAHNTVNVDEYIHRKTPGSLSFLGCRDGFKVVTAESGDAYRVTLKDYEKLLAYNVDFERTIALVDDAYVIVRDRLRGRDGISHRYDWCFHALGDFAADTRPEETGKFFRGPGYGYGQIAWKKFYRLAGPFSGGWRDGDTGLRIFVPGAADALLATGLAPVPSHGDKALKEGSNPTHKALLDRGGIDEVVLRKEGSDADYLVVLEPYRGRSRIEEVRSLSADTVEILFVDGTRTTVCLGPNRSGSYSVREDQDGCIVALSGFNLASAGAAGRVWLESDSTLSLVDLRRDTRGFRGTITAGKDVRVRLICPRKPVGFTMDGRDCPFEYKEPYIEFSCLSGNRDLVFCW